MSVSVAAKRRPKRGAGPHPAPAPEALDLERVKELYDLEDLRLVGSMPEGRLKGGFRLRSAGDELLLRRLRWDPGYLRRLPDEHRFVGYLAGRGFPVSAPIQARDGETIAWMDGAAHVLCPFVKGIPFRRGSQRHVTAAARTLAVYHRLAADYPGPLAEPDLEFWEPFLAVARDVPALAPALAEIAPALRMGRDLEHLVSELAILEGEARRLPYLELPKVVVHGDYGRNNLIFRRGGDLIAVLDFDCSRWEARSLDVTIALLKLARGGSRKVFLDPDLLRGFMAAYGGVASLEPAELQALPFLLRAKVASSAADRIVRLWSAPPVERQARAAGFRRYARRLRWLVANGPAVREAVLAGHADGLSAAAGRRARA